MIFSVLSVSNASTWIHLLLFIYAKYTIIYVNSWDYKAYLHWGVGRESGLVSMWLWFKRYRTRVSFILSPQGFKSTIYIAWLRLFRSHFAVYYRGPTLCCFTLPFVAEARHGCSGPTEAWRSGCTRGSACRSACYSTSTSATSSGSRRRSRSSSASSTGRGL